MRDKAARHEKPMKLRRRRLEHHFIARPRTLARRLKDIMSPAYRRNIAGVLGISLQRPPASNW